MNKKQKIAYLTVLAVVICILPASQVRAGLPEPKKIEDPNSSKASNDILQDLFKDRQDVPQPELLRHFVSAIAVVILLGACAYVLSKKVVPKLTVSRGKAVSVIETVSLGSKKSLHVLKIGTDRKILIGSTNESINYLAEITLALSENQEDGVTGEK